MLESRCRVCGRPAIVIAATGRGRPPVYCLDHRPSKAESEARRRIKKTLFHQLLVDENEELQKSLDEVHEAFERIQAGADYKDEIASLLDVQVP